jgi:hypothetical protein
MRCCAGRASPGAPSLVTRPGRVRSGQSVTRVIKPVMLGLRLEHERPWSLRGMVRPGARSQDWDTTTGGPLRALDSQIHPTPSIYVIPPIQALFLPLSIGEVGICESVNRERFERK